MNAERVNDSPEAAVKANERSERSAGCTERWRLAGWPGGVSPPVWKDTEHSLVTLLSGETPLGQPARRQRSD